MLTYAKAAAAGLVAGLTSLAGAIGDGGLKSLSAQDIIYAVIALIIGSGIVAAVPNKPKP